MLTTEQEEVIGRALSPLFQYLEHEVIVDVAERIRETMAYSRTAEIEAQRLNELGFSPVRIRKEAMKLLKADPEYRKAVAKNTLEHKKTVKKLLREIMAPAKEMLKRIMREAADLSYLDDLRVWRQTGKKLTDQSFLPQLVEAVEKQTAGTMEGLAQSTGFKTMSGYEAMENLYRRELDKAMIKVCTGTFSREQVVYDTVHSLADSGLRNIDFASGYSMQLDTAVKLAVRTGAHQVSARIMDANIRSTGENLVYVSKHWGARNTGTGHANHEQWQGKVYFIREGQDYSAEARRIGQDRIMSLWYATGYSADGTRENDPLGLNGYNCRHKHHVWFEGTSSLPAEDPEPEPVTVNGKTYDYYGMSQKMRSMERRIRALKREREALSSLEMDTKTVSAQIKGKIKEYEEFCENCKVKPDSNRLRYECGTSDLTKTEAWKQYEDKKAACSNLPGTRVFYDESKSYTINLNDYPEEINEGLSKAAREVAKEGSETGWEHMRLVNLQNGAIECAHTDGEPSQVGGKMLWDYLKNHTEQKYAFIHNHNMATELSLPDVELMMTEPQILVVAAVRNDGIIYLVESNGKKCNEIPYIRYEKEAEEFTQNYGEKSNMGKYSVDKEIFYRDHVIKEFSKEGMRRYGE
ncbi:MAG: phage minor capsid protein [bacterium]|nr:phage minor capsid protein [bacterium]